MVEAVDMITRVSYALRLRSSLLLDLYLTLTLIHFIAFVPDSMMPKNVIYNQDLLYYLVALHSVGLVNAIVSMLRYTSN